MVIQADQNHVEVSMYVTSVTDGTSPFSEYTCLSQEAHTLLPFIRAKSFANTQGENSASELAVSCSSHLYAPHTESIYFWEHTYLELPLTQKL